MSVSGMFTQGYMDDPFTVALIVNPTKDLAATVLRDARLTVVAGLGRSFLAILATDGQFTATLTGDTVLSATVQGDGELQATVTRYTGITADVACRE